ncbi:MAG: DMT family transporter [Hyphomicrobiaceae bacterium]
MPARLIPFLFVLLWSTGFIFSKIVAAHAEPLTFLTIRFGLALLLIAGVAVATRATWPDRRAAAHATVAGALLHAGYLGPVFWAIAQGMSAGISALIVSMQPILTAFLAAWWLREQVRPRHWLGLALGIAGVALVLWPRIAEGSADAQPSTVGAALLGLAGITLGSIYQKRFGGGHSLVSAGTFQFLGGTVVVALAALMLEQGRVEWTGELIFALGWSVLVLSLGAISLLMLMIRRGAIARVAAYFYLVPPTTALMAYAIFGETLVPLQFLGMLLACLAVFLATGVPMPAAGNNRRPDRG